MKILESPPPPTDEGFDRRIIEQIHHSELYETYERAFVEATGLSLRLASADGRLVPDGARHHQNPFCALLTRPSGTCQACIRAWGNLTFFSEIETHTSTCFAGLRESCVPIRTDGKTIGHLLTGEITTSRPTPARFAKITGRLRDSGVDFDEPQLRRAYFSTWVMSQKHYGSILDLLQIFAGHMSMIAGQLILRGENSESPDINRAREFILQNLTEPLDLKQVAESANLSSCYFCRKFKESTGMTFTAYVARTRVEAAKKLLANPQVRVSEVAFEVGFQSLTHFNRVFKVISGLSPTQYREELPDAAPGPDPHSAPRE